LINTANTLSGADGTAEQRAAGERDTPEDSGR
jgi:hypothetical protein